MDAARPEPRDPAEPVVPAVLDRQYGGAGRHQRALSRHPADQSGPDGSLEHRHHAQLPAGGGRGADRARQIGRIRPRSEEHTSELQSLMRISYAVFCLKKKTENKWLDTSKLNPTTTNNYIERVC